MGGKGEISGRLLPLLKYLEPETKRQHGSRMFMLQIYIHSDGQDSISYLDLAP